MYVLYQIRLFSSSCVDTAELLSWHGCLWPVGLSLRLTGDRRPLSGTALWTQAPFYGKLPIHHTPLQTMFSPASVLLADYTTRWDCGTSLGLLRRPSVHKVDDCLFGLEFACVALVNTPMIIFEYRKKNHLSFVYVFFLIFVNIGA